MKFWLDMSTPKEVMFFNVIRKELLRRGHELIITTRHYRETNDLLNYFGIDAAIIGRHGISREDKLQAGLERMQKLLSHVKHDNIWGLVTLANPEACRVAFGLGIPVFNFIDILESEIVCKLTLPLSKIVFIPFHVPRWKLFRYYSGDTYIYDCLDPVAWMPKEPAPIDEVGLDEKYFDNGQLRRPFIVYRAAETRASYFKEYGDITPQVIEELKKLMPNATYYPIPRYNVHRMIDLQSLLAHADLFVGGGGTITEEATWWGTWCVTCRPFKTTYDQWLIANDLLFAITEPIQGAIKCRQLLTFEGKNSAAEKLRSQNFPVAAICDMLENRQVRFEAKQ